MNLPKFSLATLNGEAVERLNDAEIEASNAALDAMAIDRDDTFEEIARLSKLSPISYDRERAGAAARLGIRAATLDNEVEAGRKTKNAADGGVPAISIITEDVESWGEEVSTDEILRDLIRRIRRTVIFLDEQALTCVLWIGFAWSHGTFPHSPLLLVTSPEMNSGKSTLLGIIRFLVPRGFPVTQPNPANIYRAVEQWSPTLLVDEADDLFRQSNELRSIINSGWTRDTFVVRCHPDTHELVPFALFAPKAIGMKGKKLDATTLSRCIKIEMKPAQKKERPEDFDHTDNAEFRTLRRKLKRWAEDNKSRLVNAQPILPDGFRNRVAANWRPLLAIAELAGGDIPERARAAALSISGAPPETINTMLLSDCRDTYKANVASRIFSCDFVAALHAMEGRPWAEYGRSQKPISQNQLAARLKEFGIEPKTIRIGSERKKGYEIEQFREAFALYLGDEGCDEPCHRDNPYGTSASTVFQTVTSKSGVTAQNGEKPRQIGDCHDVTTQDEADDWQFNKESAAL